MTNIVIQHATIALLITIWSNFSDCQYCPVSAPTVSVVSKCPITKTEWDQAASRKKCNYMSAKCGDKSPVYHCLLNQWRNETVEVCASTWFISGFCAIYNTEEMKVIDDFNRDCTNLNDGPCPTRYISTDAYMYQGCYGKRDTSTSLPSTDKQSCVSTAAECTLPAAIIAIIIVLFLLSLSLFVLLVLTCLEKISKSVIVQCIQSCKNTTDEQTGNSEKIPKSPHHKREDKNACSTDENTISETASLLTDDQKSASTPTDKRDEENTMMTVPEKIKKFDTYNKLKETNKKEVTRKKLKKTSDERTDSPKHDRKSESNVKDPSDNMKDLNTKNEDLNKESVEEGKVIIDERTDSPKHDRKSESNVKDPSDSMKDLNTKNEDLNKESVEEGKVIFDGGTDSPDDDRKLECIDKVEQEDDRLHENDSKVMEMQCMRSYEISAGEKERGSENKYESQKDIKSSSSTSNEKKNSTEKEEQFDPIEKPPLVRARVEKFQKMMNKQN